MDSVQTLHKFWSGFGLPAYDETTVPDDAKVPYITYEASDDFFGSNLSLTASLWYRSTSWQAITEKEKEIANAISLGGKMLQCDEGAIWIKRGTPWAQRMSDSSDNMIRRIVLNIELESIK